MTNKECLDRIAKLTDELDLIDITKEQALEDLKDLSFNDIADELWEFYCFVCDVKSILMEIENDE